MIIQMRATEQYFAVVLFSMPYEVVLTFEFVDEILKCEMKATVTFEPAAPEQRNTYREASTK